MSVCDVSGNRNEVSRFSQEISSRLPIPSISCQTFPMRTLTAFLCLTFAVLLFSAGEGFALSPCPGSYNQNTWHNCVGTYTDASGDKYVGEWRGGKYHGQGTFTFGPSSQWAGDKYVGEFRDDAYNGQGTYTYADGRTEYGIWENDKLVEDGSAVLETAIDRCLYENIDKIVSDAAERIVKKKCMRELKQLSTEDLIDAYD